MIVTPRLVQAFYVVQLQNLFTGDATYPWQKDRSKTEIFIQGEYSEDAREQNIYPSILVETGGAIIASEGIGASVDHMEIHKLYLTKTAHQFVIQSQMNWHVLAESKVETEELGFQLMLFANSLKIEAGRMMGLQYVGQPSQSTSRPKERQGQSNIYQSTVSFPFQFTVRRIHTPIDQGLLLNEINTYLNLTPEQSEDVVDDGKGFIKLRVTNEDVTAEQP